MLEAGGSDAPRFFERPDVRSGANNHVANAPTNQRPQQHPLATPVQFVKGVGPAVAAKLGKMGILTVAYLLAVTPIRYLDRRQILPVAELSPGRDRTVVGTIAASGVSFLGGRRKRIYEIVVDDGTGKVSAKFFYFNQKYFQQKYPPGTRVLLSGDAS